MKPCMKPQAKPPAPFTQTFARLSSNRQNPLPAWVLGAEVQGKMQGG
jgi:hypothetical protein